MKTAKQTVKQNERSLWQRVKSDYRSLILGIFVFLIGFSLLLRIVSLQKGKEGVDKKETGVGKEIKKAEKENNYTVQKGDYLWKIAENFYGSGYDAYDIAKANNLQNPSLIFAGQVLLIPSIQPKQPTTTAKVMAKETKQQITEPKTQSSREKSTKPLPEKYTVKRGDHLWKIAQEVYGDPYRWIAIAQANKLVNPSFIHAGNVFVIPKD